MNRKQSLCRTMSLKKRSKLYSHLVLMWRGSGQRASSIRNRYASGDVFIRSPLTLLLPPSHSVRCKYGECVFPNHYSSAFMNTESCARTCSALRSGRHCFHLCRSPHIFLIISREHDCRRCHRSRPRCNHRPRRTGPSDQTSRIFR